MDVNVKVAVRCRPLSKTEISKGCANIVSITPTSVTLKLIEKNEDKVFTFDHCYYVDTTQEQVYNDLGRSIVLQAFEGYNGTLFAYGQSGSGKTFTVMGTPEERGIIPRLSNHLFEIVNEKILTQTSTKFMITVSYLEIYNERVKDLLNPSEEPLKISEHPVTGFFVKDLCELIVRTQEDIYQLIEQGNTVRKVATTNLNEASSRSHSVFTITLEQKTITSLENGMSREQMVKAKLNLVDLAGSERIAKTGATGGTLKEGVKINLSLMTLGTVINALAAGDKKAHIPYRDSALTKLLKESLGGNAATVMIAAISPADYNCDETLGTLKYATRARSIENTVVKNEDNNDKVIRELKEMIEKLKQEIVVGKTDPELEEKLALMQMEQQNTWEEKERLSRALEEARQQNMNNVISNLMNDIKEKKLENMKQIKLLQIEKTDLTKKQKIIHEKNELFKLNLDKKMKEYMKLQEQYESINSNSNSNDNSNNEKEVIASNMATLLSDIESDREKWTEKRDQMKILKNNLIEIERKFDEAKAELLATHNLLDQNNEMRQKIIDEERMRAKEIMDKEILKAKTLLETEKANVRGTVEAELSLEMSNLRQELNETKNMLSINIKDLSRKNDKITDLQSYIDKLEERLVDAEALHESAENEILLLKNENEYNQEIIQNSNNTIKELNEKLNIIQNNYEIEKLELKKQIQNDMLIEYNKMLEDEKYLLFKNLMTAFQNERAVFEKKNSDLSTLLSQATKDIVYLSTQNEELNNIINDLKYQEPDIIPTNGIRKMK